MLRGKAFKKGFRLLRAFRSILDQIHYILANDLPVNNYDIADGRTEVSRLIHVGAIVPCLTDAGFSDIQKSVYDDLQGLVDALVNIGIYLRLRGD